MSASVAPLLDPNILGGSVGVSQRSIDRFAIAHDASHYLLIPDAVLKPSNADDVARIFRASHVSRRPITFRSGGTSLSGQGVSGSVLVDSRTNFQYIEVLDGGRRVRVQPGATLRQSNARLLRHGRRLGPDPASEIACTIGGVVANNSSGMACGIEQNTYRTLESMIFVLPSGTTVDTSKPDADEQLRHFEPDIHAGLRTLRERIVSSVANVAEIERQYSRKNTMGYGLNSFVDFDLPVDILAHLIIGSEGTLAFVAEATFRTVELPRYKSTGLLVFPTLGAATAALPSLVHSGLATIELMDARSLSVAQRAHDAPKEIASLDIENQAAYLVEFHDSSRDGLASQGASAEPLFRSLDLSTPFSMTMDASEQSALWHVRKGLYTTVAGARPSGTTALLEDIAVPVDQLLGTCEDLTAMFDRHGYEESVIFGHAKDGNIHFMLNERFDDAERLARYERFTEEMVDMVLARGGSLKAEHGTGRIMAPFVRRQYGDELYSVMLAVKELCDPQGLLNPDVLISSDPKSHVRDLKTVPAVESEVDRCVECGYCEPTCPSKNVTMTPRQRIVVRREMQRADDAGDLELLDELRSDYGYEGVETCAVDGMCAVACPVDINTGDLVRRLRAEQATRVEQGAWKIAARNWGPITVGGALALSAAKVVPSRLVRGATKVGRAILGDERVPLYSGELPGGGKARPKPTAASESAEVVLFAACIGTMFGQTADSGGVTSAFLELCKRAGVEVTIPEASGSLCCGTPWKSKGFLDGYTEMSQTVLPALMAASRGGSIPIVCDAASCTEGLQTMQALSARAVGEFSALRFIDAVEFTRDRILPALIVTRPVRSIALHYTCSTTELGVNQSMLEVARFISDDVDVPVDWGCCAFAGDRGLLHPELTASATAAEAAIVNERLYGAYASANRTCEIGMTRATGHDYQHLLELVEEATRA